MPCTHYPSGDITCAVCIHGEVLELEEQVKKLRRKQKELMWKLGEEPKE